MTRLLHIEVRLDELYRAGHVTGYGAGTTDHPKNCEGCAETRVLAHRWDAFWQERDAAREAAANRPVGKAW